MGSGAMVKDKVTLEPKMDRDLIVCADGDAPDCHKVVNLGRITEMKQAPSNCVEIATADFPGAEKSTTIVFAFADGITYRR